MTLKDHTKEVVPLPLEPVGGTPDGCDRRDVRGFRRDRGLDDHLVTLFQREQVVDYLKPLHVIDYAEAAEVVEVQLGSFFGEATDRRNILGLDSDHYLVQRRAVFHVKPFEH